MIIFHRHVNDVIRRVSYYRNQIREINEKLQFATTVIRSNVLKYLATMSGGNFLHCAIVYDFTNQFSLFSTFLKWWQKGTRIHICWFIGPHLLFKISPGVKKLKTALVSCISDHQTSNLFKYLRIRVQLVIPAWCHCCYRTIQLFLTDRKTGHSFLWWFPLGRKVYLCGEIGSFFSMSLW